VTGGSFVGFGMAAFHALREGGAAAGTQPQRSGISLAVLARCLRQSSAWYNSLSLWSRAISPSRPMRLVAAGQDGRFEGGNRRTETAILGLPGAV
jgi:hypothetical protein